jgi:hypothetical protein
MLNALIWLSTNGLVKLMMFSMSIKPDKPVKPGIGEGHPVISDVNEVNKN